MATAQSILIEAIRRIAGIEPDVLALLKEIQKRGGIDGIKTELGGDGGVGDDEEGREPSNKDCCSDTDPITRDPWNPPGSDPDDPWNDCETGDPITFDPAGFPQPETCKECEPDPDWEPGYKWCALDKCGPDPSSVVPDDNTSGPIKIYYRFGPKISETSFSYERQICTPEGCDEWKYAGPIVRQLCRPSDYTDGTCTGEPPEKCGDNWQPDSTTSYTLVNGCIVASSCDTDASEQAKQCNECINICDSAGNQWTVCTTGDGGFVAYDPSGEKDGVKYNSNGQQQSVIPAGSGAGGFI